MNDFFLGGANPVRGYQHRTKFWTQDSRAIHSEEPLFLCIFEIRHKIYKIFPASCSTTPEIVLDYDIGDPKSAY